MDTVIGQLKDRLYSCLFLLRCVTSLIQVADPSATCGMDAVSAVRELNEFRQAYRSAHHVQ